MRARWSEPGALVPYLVILALAALAIVGLAVRPEAASVSSGADHVLIAGAAGLRWDDIDPERTPQLWQLASSGALGSLAVRSARSPTCLADGWLTLGAGNWAADVTGSGGPDCDRLAVAIETGEAAGAYLPNREALVRANRWQLPWGTVPGALPGAVECTTAVGEGGALAAARVFGRVDRYLPELPADRDLLIDQLGRCELGIVDLGTISGTGAPRQRAVARVDAALAEVVVARPQGSLLLVAGVADPDPSPHLQLVIGHGPGLSEGLLTSDTTRRTGYVQLVDLAPTALAALGRPTPQVRFSGSAVRPVAVPTGEPEQEQQRLVAIDGEAGRAEPVRVWFLAGLAGAQLLLLAGMTPLLRPADGRWRRGQVLTAGSRAGRLAQLLLVAASLVAPAALAVGALPWWRAGPPLAMFTGACLLLVAVLTVLVVRSPVFGHTLTVLGVCGGLAVAVVAADLLSGAHLQLNGVMGYSAHDGGRYAGVGPIGAGMLMAGTLLIAGALAQQVTRRWRPAVVVAVGAVGVVLLGNTYLGAELGAAVALTVGVCVAAVMSTGGWLTFSRVAWASIAGLVIVAAVALLDLRRPVGERGGLGRMVTELTEGTAGFGLQRASLSSWEAFAGSPLTLLAVGAGLYAWLVLLRPAAGLKRLFGVYPAVHAGMSGMVLAVVVAGVLTGTALIPAAAAAAVALPLATLAAMRVRQQAAPRAATGTVAPASTYQLLW